MTHIVTVCNCLLSEGTDWIVAPLKNSKKCNSEYYQAEHQH